MRASLAAAVAALSLMGAGQALAGDAKPADKPMQLAWFQPRTIFNSGLVGTHTVALTFDDGPNEDTQAVLKALRKAHVKATFFIVGRMARRHPEILRQIAAEGHLLANHSATHPLLGSSYDSHPEKLIAQIKQVNDEIAPLQPRGTRLFFRAPYGSWRSAHAKILNDDPVLKHYIGPIYWNVGGETRQDSDGYVMSSADWSCWKKGWSAQVCAKGYLREIRRENGGVVLMHCIHAKSGALVAAVLPALIQEGYRFVRLDQVPYYDRYKTPEPKKTPEPVIAVAQAGRLDGAAAAP